MKFLATIDVAEGAALAELRSLLPDEVRHSWSLYASGVLREAYATERPTRVVFILEAADRAGAEAALRTLPLVAGGQFRVELTELRPFLNWAMVATASGQK